MATLKWNLTYSTEGMSIKEKIYLRNVEDEVEEWVSGSMDETETAFPEDYIEHARDVLFVALDRGCRAAAVYAIADYFGLRL